MEQNDALINALKDSEHKLDTSVEVENTLLEEVQVAKSFEDELARTRDQKISLERELELSEERANSLREQLDESDAARERLETSISEAHQDLARARSDMKDLRERILKYETNSESIDQSIIRLKVQLEEEQGEVQRLSGLVTDLEGTVERTKAELGAAHARERRIEVQLSERDAEVAQLEADLSSARLGRDTVVSKETDNRQQRAVMAAKISELEKELDPLRAECNLKSEKLSREKELSMELASTVSRLKDQIQIQIDNYTKLEASNKDLKRKSKEYQEEIASLDRRKSTLTSEVQKMRELLNEVFVVNNLVIIICTSGSGRSDDNERELEASRNREHEASCRFEDRKSSARNAFGETNP